MAKKKHGLLKLAIVGAVVAVLGVGVYHGIKHQDKIKDAWNNLWGIEEQVPEEKPTPDDPSGGEEQPLVNTVTIEIEGQDPTTQSVASGGLMEEPEAPTKEGYIFQGWALKGTTEPIDFSTFIVEGDITLVPLWIEEPVILDYIIEDGVVIQYSGNSSNVVIPSSYSIDAEGNIVSGKEYLVTAIARDVFCENKDITSLFIPEGVVSIGDFAFAYCSNLTAVTIPDSVKNIGHNAFTYCTSLQEVSIPTGVVTLGISCFSCTKISGTVILEKVETVSNRAFEQCNNLENVIFKTVEIPDLGEEFVFPNSVNIYVPDELMEAWKTATNWSSYADQIKPVSEYEEA
ncbi:MAG: leucine-rich repeat protein [Clostridia bacterium]|nr:leucine-rich repeat protein [Clostridia bacterium]